MSKYAYRVVTASVISPRGTARGGLLYCNTPDNNIIFDGIRFDS